ncbi:transposase family protein [Streptomyces sp. NPDC001617]
MHGLHVLAFTDEHGNLIWVSGARRGRTHDVTAARHDRITAHLREAGIGAFADLGFLGLDDDPDNPVIITGYRAARGRRLTAAQEEANKLVARERAASEHGFADLKNWRVLTKLRLNSVTPAHCCGPCSSSPARKSPGDGQSPATDPVADQHKHPHDRPHLKWDAERVTGVRRNRWPPLPWWRGAQEGVRSARQSVTCRSCRARPWPERAAGRRSRRCSPAC